jgi:hypothetical protein
MLHGTMGAYPVQYWYKNAISASKSFNLDLMIGALDKYSGLD